MVIALSCYVIMLICGSVLPAGAATRHPIVAVFLAAGVIIGGYLSGHAWRGIPDFCRVGILSWPLMIIEAAIQIGVILATLLIILPRAIVIIPPGLMMYWDTLIFLLTPSTIFGQAVRYAINGHWQRAIVAVISATPLMIVQSRFPATDVMLAAETYLLNKGDILVSPSLLQVTVIAAGLASGLLFGGGRPLAASVEPAPNEWAIRGLYRCRYISLTAKTTPAQLSTVMASAVQTYSRLPAGWREVAGREQMVRIAAAVSRSATKGAIKSVDKRLTQLTTQLADLERGTTI